MIFNIIAGIDALIGIYAAVFMLSRAIKNKNSRSMFANLLALAVADAWVAVIYALAALEVVVVPVLTVGMFIRPAMILLFLVPILIVKRANI